MPKENAHPIDFEWTEDEQAKLMVLVERYTSCGASGEWRVHCRWLTCYLLVLGDMPNRNDVSGRWYAEWLLDDWVNSPVFECLRETFLPMLVK